MRRTIALRGGTGRVRAVLALGVVLGLGSISTGAYWTDDVPVTGILLATGNLDLKVNNQDSVSGYTGLTITGMVPGNSVAAVLTINNTGNVPFTYTATSTATDPDGKNLRGALVIKVTGNGSVTGSSPTATCSGSALSGTGTALNGSLVSTPRTLVGGASETLCIQVTLPSGAGNSVQSASTAATLQFDAAQVP